MSNPEAESHERRQKVDRVQPLLTKARMALRRLDFHSALEQCAEILRQVPDCAAAWEIKGDVHRALGEHSAALDAYAKFRELEPGNRRVEMKFAAVTVDMDETRLLEERRKEVVSNPKSFLQEQKNPVYSCLLSGVLPGMGQMYNDEYAKGGIVLGLAFLTAYLTVSALWQIVRVASSTTGGVINGQVIQESLAQAGMGRLVWLLVVALAALGVWTYGIVDAIITTNRENRRRAAEYGLDVDFDRQLGTSRK